VKSPIASLSLRASLAFVTAAKSSVLADALASLRAVATPAAPGPATDATPAAAATDATPAAPATDATPAASAPATDATPKEDNAGGLAFFCVRRSLESAASIIALQEATPGVDPAKVDNDSPSVEPPATTSTPAEATPVDAEEALKQANEVLKSFNDELRTDNEILDQQATEARSKLSSLQEEALTMLKTENAEQRNVISELSKQVEELKALIQ